MKARILKAITAAFTVIALSGAVHAKNDIARVDIDGIKGRVKITSMTKNAPGIRFYKAGWRKKLADFYYTSSIKVSDQKWTDVTFTFKTDKDGQVKVMLLSRWMSKAAVQKRGGKWPWVLYKNVKVEGSEIQNGNFSEKNADGKPTFWKLSGKAEYTTSKDADGKEVPCVKVRCYAPASQYIPVKKDQPVKISFSMKLAD